MFMNKLVSCLLLGTLCLPLAINAQASIETQVGKKAAPIKRWWNQEPPAFMLIPTAASFSTSDEALGSLMTAGWRLHWSSQPEIPGKLLLRISLKVKPLDGIGSETAVLQLGVSDQASASGQCPGPDPGGDDQAQQHPDELINGQRYTVWTHEAEGMSQRLVSRDLSAKVQGRCYVVSRYSYLTSAADADPSALLTEKEGFKLLDDSLASLRLGTVHAGNVMLPK